MSIACASENVTSVVSNPESPASLLWRVCTDIYGISDICKLWRDEEQLKHIFEKKECRKICSSNIRKILAASFLVAGKRCWNDPDEFVSLCYDLRYGKVEGLSRGLGTILIGLLEMHIICPSAVSNLSEPIFDHIDSLLDAGRLIFPPVLLKYLIPTRYNKLRESCVADIKEKDTEEYRLACDIASKHVAELNRQVLSHLSSARKLAEQLSLYDLAGDYDELWMRLSRILRILRG